MQITGDTGSPKVGGTVPFIVVIRNGPIWFPRAGLGFIASAFSQIAEGELWSHGNAAKFQVGRMRVRCVGTGGHGKAGRLRFLLLVLLRCIWLRWIQRRNLTVITYDPLENGLVGVAVKWLCQSQLVCEVNGVYTSPFNLVDLPDVKKRERKRSRMIAVGSWVLRRADHIKLLYSGQADGFAVHSNTPQTAFFDIFDNQPFPPTPLGREKLLLFVGYPFYRKGVDVLLLAFAIARQTFPDWTLHLVGWRLKEEAVRAELPLDGVEIHGPKPQSEVASLVERCQGLVLPSRSEGMGRVLLEAARVGRARIGSAVDGIPFFITHDEDGLLFPPNDIKALASTLELFFGDEGLRQRLAEGARDRAQEDFISARYIADYRDLLDSLR